MSETATAVYQRQRNRGLTMPQLNAIDLLVTGKTDSQTAELLGLHRTTVSKWRLYDPTFAAALNQRRVEVWGAAVDRLRAIIPRALDTLADEMANRASPHRFEAALALLQLAQLPPVAPVGPTDPEAVVRGIVEDRRRESRSSRDDDFEGTVHGLPPFEEQVERTWSELDRLANESEPPGAEGKTGEVADSTTAPGEREIVGG